MKTIQTELDEQLGGQQLLSVPNFRQDTISSFMSRVLQTRKRAKPYDQRTDDVIFKDSRYATMRVSQRDPLPKAPENMQIKIQKAQQARPKSQSGRNIATFTNSRFNFTVRDKTSRNEDLETKFDYSNSVNERILYSQHGRNQSFTRSFGNVMY